MEEILSTVYNKKTVYEMIRGLRKYCTKYQRPYLVECMTFRMRGHEEASGVKYVPKELMADWGKKDPVVNYENWLRNEHVLGPEEIEGIRQETARYIETELSGLPEPVTILPDTDEELADVYAPA